MASVEQRALLGGVLLVVVIAFGLGWKWVQGPESIAEHDEAQALRDPLREKVQAKRQRQRSEWERRLDAWWRLGERKRKKDEAA